MVTVPVPPPDRLLALEAENAELRSRLQEIEKRDSELTKANDALKRSLTALTTANSLPFFLQTVLQQTIYASGAVSGAVFVYNSSSHTLDLAEMVLHGEILNVQTDPRAEILRRVPADISGLWEQMSQNEKIFWFEIEKAPREHWRFTDSWDAEMGHRMLATIPLKVGKQVLGYLGLAFADVQPPTEIKLEQANALTQQIALALQISRLSEEAQKAAVAKLNEVVAREREQAAQERAEELANTNAAMQRSLTSLVRSKTLEAFLPTVLQEAIDISGAITAAVFVYQPASETFTLIAQYVLGRMRDLKTDPEAHYWSNIPAKIQAVWKQIAQAETIHWYDNSTPPPDWDYEVEWHQRKGHHGIAGIPMLVDGQIIGLLRLAFVEAKQPEGKLEQCQFLAHQIALALCLSQLSEEAQKAAIAREQEKTAQERAAELATINKALIQRDRLLAVVAQVTQDLLENLNVEQAIAQALQKLGEASGASRMTLFHEKPEPQTGRLQHHIMVEWTLPNVPRLMDNPDTCSLYSDDYPDIAAELHAGRSTSLHLKDYPPPAPAFWAKFGVHSRSIVPILIEGEYFGCVCFDDCFQYHPWSEQEMDILTAGAGAIGAALLRQRLTERAKQSAIVQEQERAKELIRANEALKRSVSHLTSTNNLQLFLDAILQEAIQVCGVASAVVFIYNQACQTVELQALMILGEAIQVATDPRAAVYRPAKEANGLPLLANCDPKIIWLEIDDPLVEYWSGGRAWHQHYGHQLLNIVPCYIGTQLLGYLGMAFTSSEKPSPTQIEQSWTLAQYVALALQLAQLAEEGKQAAIFAERNRIASDIHDTLAQAFTGISLQLEVAKPLIHQEPAIVEQILHHISQLTKNGLDEARRSVWALYPPGTEYANLAQMLYNSVEQMSRNTPISLEVNIVGEPCSLSPYLGMNLLRIGQEALTNALKHSQAQTVLIELAYTTESVSLLIRDDGRGFVPPTSSDGLNGGFGLVGMYERCDRISALLSIVSQPGQGTQILVQSPLS